MSTGATTSNPSHSSLPILLRLFISSLIVAMPLLAGCRHEATGPQADAYAVRGIDVSAHNGAIDFDAVAADGIHFVMIKASEGTDWQDRSLTRNYAGARRAGLKVGLYHFFRFDSPGDLQALNFADAASMRPSDMPLVIDLEEFGNPRFTPTRQVQARLDSCIAGLRRRGYDVMLYTNKRGYSRFIEGRYDSIPLWLCALDEGSPAERNWTIWQHSHRGRVDGVSGNVDLNVFCGDSASFASFASKGNNHPLRPL